MVSTNVETENFLLFFLLDKEALVNSFIIESRMWVDGTFSEFIHYWFENVSWWYI